MCIRDRLKGVEQAGFITRTPVAEDARLKSLAVTEKGMACYDQLERCITAFEERLQQDVSEEELQQLETILSKLLQNATAVQNAPYIE